MNQQWIQECPSCHHERSMAGVCKKCEQLFCSQCMIRDGPDNLCVDCFSERFRTLSKLGETLYVITEQNYS